MLSVHQWVAYEINARGCTAFDFFSDMYEKEVGHRTHGNASLNLKRHSEYFKQFGLVQSDCWYVWRQFETTKKAAYQMPLKAVP